MHPSSWLPPSGCLPLETHRRPQNHPVSQAPPKLATHSKGIGVLMSNAVKGTQSLIPA